MTRANVDPVAKHIVARAHEREQLWPEEDADRAEDGRGAEPHEDRLDGGCAPALSGSFSPMRRATVAAAPIESPIASA